jgi:hypothetical protein
MIFLPLQFSAASNNPFYSNTDKIPADYPCSAKEIACGAADQLSIPISRAARPRSAEVFAASLDERCPKLSDTAHSLIFVSRFSGVKSQFPNRRSLLYRR